MGGNRLLAKVNLSSVLTYYSFAYVVRCRVLLPRLVSLASSAPFPKAEINDESAPQCLHYTVLCTELSVLLGKLKDA